MPLSETDARRALDAVPGLAWTPFARADAPALLDLYAACERADDNPERWSLAALLEYWDAPRSRPAEDVLVGRDPTTGDVVAVAWSGCNRAVTERRGVHLGGAVHPSLRGRGVGRAVMAWQVAHAEAWNTSTRERGFGPLVLRLHAPAQQDDVRRLAARHGLQPTRWFVEMSRPLDDLPPAPPSDGVRLLDWSEGRSGEVHRVLDRAFADHWGHAYRTAEMWAEQTSASSFRPAWSVLAVDETTDAVVGAAFSCAYVQDWTVEGRTEGYTDELGVLRSHRGRGVARTLLVASMRRFAAAGMDAAALGVDTENPSGALGLYRWPGYVETATTCSADGRRPRPTAWMRDSGVGSARRPRYCASRAGKRSTWSLNRSSPGPGTGSVRGMAFICCAVAGRTRRS